MDVGRIGSAMSEGWKSLGASPGMEYVYWHPSLMIRILCMPY